MKFWMIFALAFFYFSTSWFFPWENFQGDSTLSISYFFDVIVLIVFGLILRKKMLAPGKLTIKGSGIRIAVVVIYGLICIYMTKSLGFNSPFKYIDLQFVQLVLLAPFIEELLFRGVFYSVGRASGLNAQSNLVLNSLFFSISHLPAIWVLPAEFHNFIFFQLFYTFILGWLCVKARHRSEGIIEPYLLHLIFNLEFYFAVQYFGL